MADAKLVFKAPATGSAALVFGWQPDAPAGTPGRLVFRKPATSSGRLVFGDNGAPPPAAPDAVLGIDAELPGLGQLLLRTGAALGMDAALPGLGTLLLRAGAVTGMDASLPGFEDGMGLQWDANVSRGGLRHELGSHWQQAQLTASALQTPWQQAQAMRVGTATQWQAGQRTNAAMQASWQQAQQLRHAVQQHWQDGQGLRHATRQHWQEATRLRTATTTHWQETIRLRHALRLHWQETIRLRHATRQHWQNAIGLRASTHPTWGHGIFSRTGLHTHWQNAMRPLAGVETKPPPPKPPSCRNQLADAGYLLFDRASTGTGLLLFVCHRATPPGPGGVVVVPIRRTYIVINSITLHRLDTGAELHAHGFSMSLDYQSWTWQWSASLHHDAADHLGRDAAGDPPVLVASVNGTPFRLRLEKMARDRRFNPMRWAVSGRGLAATLAAPWAANMGFGNTLDRNAHQLAQDVLTVNGVSIGWGLDWQIDDWMVPAGAWAMQGSYIEAITDIAGSVGGYVQPHATDAVLRILPKYPHAPWDWPTLLTPDFELPAAVGEVEATEYVEKPAYTGIWLGGQSKGVFGPVTRAGTAGDALAPEIRHPLITDATAHRMRGLAELSDTGTQEHITLTMQVLPSTGVIVPGKVVRYLGHDKDYLGIVRATSINWQSPKLRQSLLLETHP